MCWRVAGLPQELGGGGNAGTGVAVQADPGRDLPQPQLETGRHMWLDGSQEEGRKGREVVR